MKNYTKILALFLLFTNVVNGQLKFDDKTSFDYFIGVTDMNRTEFITEYMFLHQKDVYKEFSNDEFEFNSKKESLFTTMVNDFSVVKANKEFYVTTEQKFGEYNFDNQSFSFSPFTKNSYIETKYLPKYYECKKCETVTVMNLFFTNWDKINSFSMPQDAAKEFIKKRKDSYGNVRRYVNMRTYFTIEERYNCEVTPQVYYTESAPKVEVELFAKITRIEIIDVTRTRYSNTEEIISTIDLGGLPTQSTPDKQEASEESKEIKDLKTYLNTYVNDVALRTKLLQVINEHK